MQLILEDQIRRIERLDPNIVPARRRSSDRSRVTVSVLARVLAFPVIPPDSMEMINISE
jgi:hypothetical protein